MRGSSFTHTCQQLAFLRDTGRADLHTHTTFSDGTCTPDELIDHAVRAGLKVLAITDHDTLAAIVPARQAAGSRMEIVAGVEITSEFRESEVHLLGLFVRHDDSSLNNQMSKLKLARRKRALEIGRRLTGVGVSIQSEIEALANDVSIGRRHLAKILVARGFAKSVHGAFVHWLARADFAEVPKLRLPIGEAIALVRGAGGVSSLAHPPSTIDESTLRELQSLGLQAMECAYPWPTRSREIQLRTLAARVGLAITGGSDTHEPGPSRGVGARTITSAEVDRIRTLVRDDGAFCK